MISFAWEIHRVKVLTDALNFDFRAIFNYCGDVGDGVIITIRLYVQLLQWKFDWRFMVRGLVLDKRRGCILKVRSCPVVSILSRKVTDPTI